MIPSTSWYDLSFQIKACLYEYKVKNGFMNTKLRIMDFNDFYDLEEDSDDHKFV